MSGSKHRQVLHPTRIDIPAEIRLYLIALLNQNLACTVDLRTQAKQASWNVRGHDFSQLQRLFATIATELDAYTDLMADRIVVLGGVALGTVRTAVTQSSLPEYPGDIAAGNAHAQALVERVAHYATAIRAALEHAATVEDGPTTNIYIDISSGIETQLSLLEAYLYE